MNGPTTRDDEDRKATLEALQESVEKYRTLIENVPVILWTIAATEWTFVSPGKDSIHGVWTIAASSQAFISPNVEQILGYTAEEIYDPDYPKTWAESIHPDDFPRVTGAYEALLRDRKPMEVEYRIRRKDGRWIWMSTQALKTYEKGGELLADGISLDITERKRAESQQLALAGFGRRALTSTDEQTLMTDACRTVVEVLDVTSATVLMFEAAENAFHLPAAYGSDPGNLRIPNDPERLPALVLASDEAIRYSNLSEETRFATADLLMLGTRAGIAVPIFGRAARYGVLHARTNEQRSFSEREAAFVQTMANILAEAIERNRAERELERRTAQLSEAQALAHIGSLQMDLMSDSEHLTMVGTVQDVTAAKQSDAALRELLARLMRMQENLRRAEQMSEMGALVAGVAHEVRNPLFGISATLDAFENKFGEDQFRDYVAALREQVDRMNQLMGDLLEYGRPIASTLRSQSPSPVLHRAVQSMQMLAQQKRVTLRCTVDEPLPPVRMDRRRLLLVFENLLKNAIEHSPEGGEVEVSAASGAERTTVIIEVGDRGPGFAPEDLPRIFEPFFTRRRGGTGLGLSLARRILDAHDGTMRASNRRGGGASMVVTLPVAERT